MNATHWLASALISLLISPLSVQGSMLDFPGEFALDSTKVKSPQQEKPFRAQQRTPNYFWSGNRRISQPSYTKDQEAMHKQIEQIQAAYSVWKDAIRHLKRSNLRKARLCKTEMNQWKHTYKHVRTSTASVTIVSQMLQEMNRHIGSIRLAIEDTTSLLSGEGSK